MESGPLFNVVLGEGPSLRLVVGDDEPFRVLVVILEVSVSGLAAVGSDLPDIMDSHIESTSIVEALASTRGFFSTFLKLAIEHQWTYYE